MRAIAPDRFDLLYYYDGEQLIPAQLEVTGEKSYRVTDRQGNLWEPSGRRTEMDISNPRRNVAPLQFDTKYPTIMPAE